MSLQSHLTRWIPSHINLLGHPKLDKLVELSGLTRAECFVRLHQLWYWALNNAPNGALKVYSDAGLSVVVGWGPKSGNFVQNLRASGWIDADKRIHDWNKYGGKYLRRKDLNAQRMRQARERQSAARSSHSAAHGAQHVRHTDSTQSAACAHLEERRGEKSREEKNKGGVVIPQGAVAEPVKASATSEFPAEIPGNPSIPEEIPHPEPTNAPETSPKSKKSGPTVDVNGHPFAEWPTREEWAAAAAAEGLTPQQIAAEWAYQERLVPAKRWLGVDRTRLRHHAAWRLGQLRAAGAGAQPSGATKLRGGERWWSHEQQGPRTRLKKLN
jgi:hypothetical protein